MTELTDFKRIIYEPEVERYQARISALTARVRELEAGLDQIEGQAVCAGMDGPDGDVEMLKRIADIARQLLSKETT